MCVVYEETALPNSSSAVRGAIYDRRMTFNASPFENMDPWLSSDAFDAENSIVSRGFDDDFKPYLRMNDSSSYITTLESKLERIRGDNKQLTGRIMIKDAERRKDDHLSNFLQDLQGSYSAWIDDSSAAESTNETHLQTMLKLKFCPEKCALSAEELQNLLQADQLNLINETFHQDSDQNFHCSSLDDAKMA